MKSPRFRLTEPRSRNGNILEIDWFGSAWVTQRPLNLFKLAEILRKPKNGVRDEELKGFAERLVDS